MGTGFRLITQWHLLLIIVLIATSCRAQKPSSVQQAMRISFTHKAGDSILQLGSSYKNNMR